jgi:cell division protein FtsZ
MSNDYEFDLPQQQNFIKVIGVGGGGGNAARNMYRLGIAGVDFIICNTDVQALEDSPIPRKLALGKNLTGGLGAGANPEIGRNAAIESKEDIKSILSDGTKMVFITAGMGGGTGTGAAPVIAEIASKANILTVAIVTLPFSFEGKKKLEQAQIGIKSLRENCDTVLVILNDRIKDQLGNLTIGNAFAKADEVQTNATKSIAEIITLTGHVNVDFKDVETVMKNAGTAVMGSGSAEGESRAINAVQSALSSPLLEYKDIHGAKKILLSIVFGKEAELSMEELTIITDYIREKVGEDAEMIFGYGLDNNLKEHLKVTIIATGFLDFNSEKKEYVVEDKLTKNKLESSNTKKSTSIHQQNSSNNKTIQSIPLDFSPSTTNSSWKNNQATLYDNLILIPAYKRQNIELDFNIDNRTNKLYINTP